MTTTGAESVAPRAPPQFRDFLSYGGGRQTAGMLALIALGRLRKPDAIVMADTGGEKGATYRHLESWAKPMALSLGIPFEVVRYTIRGEVVTLYEYSFHYRWLPQPWQRMCTRKFKVVPINRYLRRFKASSPLRVWIGISREEAHRRHPSSVHWIEHVYPLVDAGLGLTDCIAALEEVGAPIPPKSSCFFCPFQRRAGWQELQRKEPRLFAEAIRLEERAREKNPRVTLNGRAPLKVYLEGEQSAWDELLEGEAGCNSGRCFV